MGINTIGIGALLSPNEDFAFSIGLVRCEAWNVGDAGKAFVAVFEPRGDGEVALLRATVEVMSGASAFLQSCGPWTILTAAWPTLRVKRRRGGSAVCRRESLTSMGQSR